MIFAETVAKALADYRSYLRKSRDVDQATRVSKLAKLGLKEVNIFSGDVELFDTAMAVLEDISETIDIPEEGYYTYSGIANYYEKLNEFMQDYDIEGEGEDKKVFNRAQRASKAILRAVQLMNGKPAHVLSDNLKQEIYLCHQNIIAYGKEEQFEIYRSNLTQLKPNAPLFYTDLIRHFDNLVQELREAA